MNFKRFIFVSITIIIGFLCIAYMNTNYDVLSRYPYEDAEVRDDIIKNLNDDEIEYLIEYAIAPSSFKNFINADKFNVYHIKEYNQLQAKTWQFNPNQIVTMVEDLYDILPIGVLGDYTYFYPYEVIKNHFLNPDQYQKSLNLKVIDDLNVEKTRLGDNESIGTYKPYNLVEYKNVYINEVIKDDLDNMLNAMQLELGLSADDIVLVNGYISYEDQIELYENNQSIFVPGTSMHQLGIAVDFALKDQQEYIGSAVDKWLINHCYEFGFERTYLDLKNHYRYIGK